MPDLPTITQKIEKITLELAQMAQVGGFNLKEVMEIWQTVPVDDRAEMTYLELAGKCILEVSSLVDKTYPSLSVLERRAKKLKLMSQLLALKAEELEQ